jgi:CubicO group peptidase (beta-lactamase class C family)
LHLPWRSVVALQAVLAAFVVLTGCSTLKSDNPGGGLSAADAEAIDRMFSQYSGPGVPGAAVVVIDKGRVAFTRGYGLADLETKAPVTDRTNFRLASLTKPFTAMAIMLLVADGYLQLDDRARDILPGFPAYGAEIRIRHLLTHTSGLRAYEDFVSEASTRHVKDRDVLTLLQRADGLMFPPGSAFRYGDSGYVVLGLIAETVSGQPFPIFLRDRIFAPLGMQSTIVWQPGGAEVPHRAMGYAPGKTGFRLNDHSNTSTVLGDGGIYSSVRDLVAWDRALDAHTLLSARLQRLAWTPGELNDRTKTRYGLGWFIDRDARGPFVFHRGDTTGFSNFIVKYPDRKLTVVILTNRNGGAPADMAATVAALPSFWRGTR